VPAQTLSIRFPFFTMLTMPTLTSLMLKLSGLRALHFTDDENKLSMMENCTTGAFR
jgi:hypothetical protein